MSSPRRHEAQVAHDDGPSVWPAAIAAIFAWIMALMRALIGQAHQERLNLDIALAFGAAFLIPSVVLLFWLQARRLRRSQRLRGVVQSPIRPHLRLVSSATAPRVQRSARA